MGFCTRLTSSGKRSILQLIICSILLGFFLLHKVHFSNIINYIGQEFIRFSPGYQGEPGSHQVRAELRPHTCCSLNFLSSSENPTKTENIRRCLNPTPAIRTPIKLLKHNLIHISICLFSICFLSWAQFVF